MEIVQKMSSSLIEHLRTEQRLDGSWVGEMRSGMLSFYYAAALALDKEPPDSPVIQDLCDFIESCAVADGGLAIYPGEPADVMSSTLGSLLLNWARPTSPALVQCRIFLRNQPSQLESIPLLLLSRWVFEPESRAQILGVAGPPVALRRLAMAVWPRAWSLLSYRKIFAQPSKPMSRPLQALIGPMMRWMFWPSPSGARDLSGLLAPHMVLAILAPFLALRQLAGDRTSELEELKRFTLDYMADHRYEDGSVLYINYLPSYLACAQAFGDAEQTRLLSAGLRRIEHRAGGWLRGAAIATSTLDTAMTVRALLLSNVSGSDPALTRAAAFLRDAQSDEGTWSWAWDQPMGRKFRTGDTDDTGAALAALLRCGQAPGSPPVVDAIRALERLQTASGGFNTFDIGDAANTVTVSNTSRALQALSLAGRPSDYPSIRRGCEWLLSEQEPNGKWVDYWVARWIYGTVTALEGLLLTGYLLPGAPAIDRGLNWLLRQQNLDGGWGEDWHGARSKSTAEHTAMAVYGLCLAARPSSRPLGAISGGLEWLARHQRADGGWSPAYVGAYSLLEGYANAHVPNYWVLMALGQYKQMMASPESRVVPVHRLRRTPATDTRAAE